MITAKTAMEWALLSRNIRYAAVILFHGVKGAEGGRAGFFRRWRGVVTGLNGGRVRSFIVDGCAV